MFQMYFKSTKFDVDNYETKRRKQALDDEREKRRDKCFI